MKRGLIITIDGPAASGKSSVAMRVAKRLGIAYVSSGLLYRAATHLALSAACDLENEEALAALLAEHRIRLEPAPGGNRVIVNGRDDTEQLATERVDAAVSLVAKHPRVREWVTERLRELTGSFVIDGRDMGTAVFPHAAAKFYLTADPEVRAARRAGERPSEAGVIAEQLRRRDALDAKQLAPAEDAIMIDSSRLTIEEVVETLVAHTPARRAVKDPGC